MGSWPHDTVVDAVAPTVEDTPFPATVVDRTVFPRARAASSARRESPRTSPGARTRPVRALVVAALVLALVAAYAFGVLGRDTAVGGVRPSAMTDQKQAATTSVSAPALEIIPWEAPGAAAPTASPKVPSGTQPKRN